jgi:capsular exopolysaccharide synthesis family protein
MSDRQRSEGIDIAVFFGFLRRRGLIVLLGIVVGAVAGYLISSSKEDEYEATASVLLSLGSEQFGPGVPESAVDRENLIESDPVLRRARERLEDRAGEGGAGLLGGVSAFSGQDSGTVEITATASSGEAAALAANTVARAVIDHRRESTIARLRRGETVAQRQLDEVQQESADAGSPAALSLQQRLADLRQAIAVADGAAEITSRATVPASPSSPNPSRDAVIGGFAGLLLGLVLAMTREQLDRRLKHSAELERIFGLPVLASVPRSRALASSNGRAMEQLPPSDAEAFQMLRANLRFLNTDKELRSVVVTSPGVGDGKSTVALNLAKADASVGKRVLLIEADMRRPRLAEVLGIAGDPGLSNYLADPTLQLTDVAQRVPVVHHGDGVSQPLTMDVVLAGNVPANPSELINSDRMAHLVGEAEQDYDLVVIDTAPAGVVADAIVLMSQATAVVVVGRVGRITGPEAGSLREQLERIDAPAFGLVANFARGEASGYGYYSY